MSYVEINKKDLYLCFELEEGKSAKLLKVSSQKGNWQPEQKETGEGINRYNVMRIIEIQKAGNRSVVYRGAKNFYDTPQVSLEYVSHELVGDSLVINQRGEGLLVKTTYCFYGDIPVFSCQSCIINESEEEIWLQGVTSFCYGNVGNCGKEEGKCGEDLEIYYAHNTWSEECRWVHNSLKECGVIPYGNLSYSRFRIGNHTGFSSGEYLPEGALYNKKEGESIFWQIEHNGAWSFEIGLAIGDYRESFLEKEYQQNIYLALFGPQMEGAFWQKKLKRSESFSTVSAAVAVCRGEPEEGFSILTKYRRKKKQVCSLPVIFNDYMNCFMGNSTTEHLRPYIKRAAQAGCEIFVVDCGWYDIGDWQYTFGTFEECRERYPGGLKEVMDEIRLHGMKAGLWLELESFGIENKEADKLPKEWIFTCHGKPIVDSGRYHLDFRNSEVREYASSIVKKVVERYGLDYLKIDYNLCVCWGTDFESDSLGDGLLSHNRAYLEWLEDEMKKYPQIIWENCGSGGMRMDYALLSRMDIQSVSDQEDYRIMAMIASNCATAVLPEQAGIWAYPRKEGNREETIMNMVSAMPFRICLGGQLAELSEERFLLVKEAVECYKEIRRYIPEALPYWPIGLHRFDAPWLCYGFKTEKEIYLSVIRRSVGKDTLDIPFDEKGQAISIIYPRNSSAEILTSEKGQVFTVRIPEQNSGCFLKISHSLDD